MRRLRGIVIFQTCLLLLSSAAQGKAGNWVEVRSPNFIVVSNAGEKQARKAAVHFEQIRAVFRETMTLAMSHPTPVVTILAVKDEGSMRELLPEYWAKGHVHPAGMFAGQLNQFFAAVQLDVQGPNPYETFYHEYYHVISVPYVPDLPLWLAEGLAEFFGHTDIEGKVVSTGNADPVLIAELRNSPAIPLATLFQVDHTSPYYNEANKTSIFYAESWVLTHYFMIGDNMAHKPVLIAYLDALFRGKTASEAATIAFGDLKKLQNDLQNYIYKSSYYHLKRPTPEFNEDEMKFRSLSEAEADAYRGGFAAVRGRQQDAAAILEEALHLDPNVALTYQYLALSEFMSGQRDKALESSSKAISLDPKNSVTRYLRAFLQTSGSGMTSDPQTEEDLRRAIAISPDFVPPYGLLAVYLATVNRSLPEALSLAQKAVQAEPGNSNYYLALAQVLLRMNKLDEAGVAAGRAQTEARNAVEKGNAESFTSYLKQVREFQRQTSGGFGETGTRQAHPIQAGTSEKLPSSAEPPASTGSVAPFSPAAAVQMQASINVLSNALGFDFTPYLKDTMEALRQNLVTSVAGRRVTRQQTVAVEFTILKDGKIAGLKISSGSGDPALDQATQDSISAASPLPSLPHEFKGQYLRLHLGLSFIPENSQ